MNIAKITEREDIRFHNSYVTHRKSGILQDNYLSDTHMNSALSLLRKLDPEVNGLYNLEYAQAPYGYSKATGKWIQILHTGHQHWILAASGFDFGVPHHSQLNIPHGADVVSIYDSNRNTNCKQTNYVYGSIASLLKSNLSHIIVEEHVCQSQQNGFDCGVYAIAFATALLLNVNPSNCVFEDHKIRNHLRTCLLNQQLSMFPTKIVIDKNNCTRNRHFNPKPLVTHKLPIHCTDLCRRTEFFKIGSSSAENASEGENTALCDKCNIWFHKECDTIPKKIFTQKNVQFICRQCKKGKQEKN